MSIKYLVSSIKYKVLTLLIIISILNSKFLILNSVNAQEMSSQNFKVQGGNFNMTSGEKSSCNFKLSDIVGQTAAGQFSSKGYYLQAGFQNSALGSIFSFTVSPTIIDFGLLTPDLPVVKSLQLTIANGDVLGYQVAVSENQPLSTTAQAEIADTVCDAENDIPCSAGKSAKWIDNKSYGLGYHVFAKTAPQDFADDNSFRPFPSSSRNETQVVILQSQSKNVKDSALMTVKVNIGPNQPVGNYRNVINFTAVAGI